MVETEAFRAARKKRYREAMSAGPRATLEKGRMMDEMHNARVEVGHVKGADEILREAREEAESIPVKILVEDTRGTTIAEKETKIDIVFQNGGVIADTRDAIKTVEELEREIESMPREEEDEEPEVEKESTEVEEVTVNETISELEQLSTRIAQLERELKENSTE